MLCSDGSRCLCCWFCCTVLLCMLQELTTVIYLHPAISHSWQHPASVRPLTACDFSCTETQPDLAIFLHNLLPCCPLNLINYMGTYTTHPYIAGLYKPTWVLSAVIPPVQHLHMQHHGRLLQQWCLQCHHLCLPVPVWLHRPQLRHLHRLVQHHCNSLQQQCSWQQLYRDLLQHRHCQQQWHMLQLW